VEREPDNDARRRSEMCWRMVSYSSWRERTVSGRGLSSDEADWTSVRMVSGSGGVFFDFRFLIFDWGRCAGRDGSAPGFGDFDGDRAAQAGATVG